MVFILSNMVCCLAQVKNDQIEHRQKLVIDASFYRSNTTNCTLEWSCLNKALTTKCIEYHNDQWFEFTTQVSGKYYVNISNQSCRDIRGVQLLVIDGEPCWPDTYQLIACASLGTQDDIFVELDSLKSNYTYLLNVDGYLNDFCDFQIQVSTKPKGLPLNVSRQNNLVAGKITGKQVEINWQTTQDVISHYTVLRRYQADKKFKKIATTPHLRNAFGDSKLTYSIPDTVSLLGNYFYKIIATNQDSTQSVIGEYSIRNNLENKENLKFSQQNDYISIKLNYKKHTPISIYLFNAITQQFIKKTDLIITKPDQDLPLYIKILKEQGITRLEVKITDHKRKSSTSQLYEL